MVITEKMKHDWNQRAQHHARFWIATENYQTETQFIQSGNITAQALLTTIPEHYRDDWKILDIGCGIGRVLRALAPHFQQLYGVDVSSEMIAQGKKWLADIPHIQTFETSGADLREFPDAFFHLVYSYVTFQHLPRPVLEHYLGEIHRVLRPHGYLAFQLPIGPFMDVPLEDTIGMRSYPLQEIEERLQRNGLNFLHTISSSPEKYSGFTNPFSHCFHLAQKTGSVSPRPSVDWVDLEQPSFVSELDKHLYAVYADDCARTGKPQEGIQTLQTLVKNHPDYLPGWLQLATLFIETAQFQEALVTLKELTTLYPWYREGQVTFQNMLRKCSAQNTAYLTSLPNDSKPAELLFHNLQVIP